MKNPVVDDVIAVGELERHPTALLDEERAHGVHHGVDERREPLRGSVQK